MTKPAIVAPQIQTDVEFTMALSSIANDFHRQFTDIVQAIADWSQTLLVDIGLSFGDRKNRNATLHRYTIYRT
jgi:hypothetical protein